MQVEVRHDVYSMVIAGFGNPYITATYLLAMVFLGLHLWHGGSSWLQSLGLASNSLSSWGRYVGPVLAILVVAGNCSMPLSVYLGIIPHKADAPTVSPRGSTTGNPR